VVLIEKIVSKTTVVKKVFIKSKLKFFIGLVFGFLEAQITKLNRTTLA
jgi:hypothetical protein